MIQNGHNEKKSHQSILHILNRYFCFHQKKKIIIMNINHEKKKNKKFHLPCYYGLLLTNEKTSSVITIIIFFSFFFFRFHFYCIFRLIESNERYELPSNEEKNVHEKWSKAKKKNT